VLPGDVSGQVVAPFTRDMEQVRAKLPALVTQDRSSLEVTYTCCHEHLTMSHQAGLLGMVAMVLDEWGTSSPITIIIVTDGALGHGPLSLEQLVSALRSPTPPSRRPGGRQSSGCRSPSPAPSPSSASRTAPSTPT
jgi:hypothetical protein